MINYVLGLPFDRRSPTERIVLLRKQTQHKPELSAQHGRLNGLGGKVEPGESELAAMIREGEEETKLLGLTWQRVARLTDDQHFVLWVFRTQVIPTDLPVVNDVGEVFELHRIDDVVFNRIPVIPNLQWLVPLALGADKAFWPLTITQGQAAT